MTPTGAAVVAAFRTSDRLPEDFTMLKTGIGAGKRQYRCPGDPASHVDPGDNGSTDKRI